MALPADFNKIFGATATGGLTPIPDVDYSKGWEYVGSNPPTKNDFSYLQNQSDLKAQYLFKAIGGDSGAPAIGIPFFWPSASMPNAVLPEWSGMVFLKFNGATFSASAYPKLALVFPSLSLPESRGEFLRIWDDGRGVDSGRSLLSAQGDTIRNISGYITPTIDGTGLGFWTGIGGSSGPFTPNSTNQNIAVPSTAPTQSGRSGGILFDASRQVPTSTENRPRNIAFNFLVRAK